MYRCMKKIMPQKKKYRDLSRRQQDHRLFLQRIHENVSYKDNLNTNNIPNIIDIAHVNDILRKENKTPLCFNTQNIKDTQSEDNMQSVQDFISIQDTISEEKITLKEKLHTWAIEYNITQTSLTALLHILKQEGHNELPNDARTFLNTPKETIIRECGIGNYFHYGLGTALQEKLKYCTNINNISTIEININIDGLPLAKSSQSQLWPILGQIYNTNINKEPFVIGAYHGYKKPTDAKELLKDFCKEYRILHNEGLLYKNKRYPVTIRAIICDAPAKSFVSATKGHNAYFGCGKCMCEGDYLNHRMVFLDENAPLRTDTNFRNRENEEHHVSISPFEDLSINMINNFPIDYMHLICLGVMKRMIHLWIKGYQISRLRAVDINALSRDIIALKKYVPTEFTRHGRAINEVDRWKATEFRLFLLYLGPIILDKYLNNDYFKHFCILHTAIRILCHPEDCLRNNTYANELLLYFVKTFKILYGEDNIVYNIHNLIHISQDVKNNGCLDTFSAFPFENHMKTLKKMLRKSEKPLSQLNNRIHEDTTRCRQNLKNYSTNIPLLLKPNGKILPLECAHSHKQIKLDYFMLTTKCPDNCCYLKDGSVFCIKYIGFKDKVPVILGNKYLDLRSISAYPCNSQSMGIHISNRQTLNLEIVPVTEIDKKGFQVFFNGIYYIMPLLHL